MTQFDPTAISEGIREAIDGYDGPAPALLFEAYRNGVSVSATNGTIGLNDPTLATTNDTFEIGSQTKMMTTAVLLQLVEEGYFSLDDRLADAMDVTHLSWMANIEDATLRQLMTHSSGIPDFLNDVPEVFEAVIDRLSQETPEPVGPDLYLELMEAIDPPALFEAGEGNSYSNTGFLLLGLLIEAATGNTLAEEFQTRIFDPAGMTSSSLPAFDRPDDILRSYVMIDGQNIDVTDLPVADLGDGGVVSSTGDMISFMKALLIDGTLVSENQMEALEQYFTTEGGPEDNEFIGHGGGTFGTVSITLFHPETGTIFSAAETMRYGNDQPSDEVFEAFTSIFENAAWDADFSDGSALDIAATAAEIEVNEAIGNDGSPATELTVDGVTLSLASRLTDIETDQLTFEGGSVLFVADEGGSDFRVMVDATDASSSDNRLVGRSGNDDFVGGRGNDAIVAGAGADQVDGGIGDDEIDLGAGDDFAINAIGNTAITGGAGADVGLTFSGSTTFIESEDDAEGDVFIGGFGSDSIQGGAGDDILIGDYTEDYGSADRIEGGTGNDLLEGGAGADVFVFATNDGDDMIADIAVDWSDLLASTASGQDFDSGTDMIELSGFGYGFTADAFANVSDIDGVATFADQGTTITFAGLTTADLSADDFILA